MKKMLITIGMCFLVLGLFAQETETLKGGYLSDQQVVPPQFIGIEEEVKIIKQSPICCFIQENLDITSLELEFYQEGTVGVEFTINKNGILSNFTITNEVDYFLEQAVIECIKQTEGQWKPGETNGIPATMEKRIYVKFDAPGNASFEEISKSHYYSALKKFHKADYIAQSNILEHKKKVRKSNRMHNHSLNHLAQVTVYLPNDPSVAFWKAKNYESLGMYKEMIEMLEKRKELLSMSLSEQKLLDHYDIAFITLE